MDRRDNTPATPATTIELESRICAAMREYHERCKWDESEEFIQLAAAGLAAASNWAHQVGIEFEWWPGDARCESEVDSDGELLWRCYARRGDKLLGCTFGWLQGTTEPSCERDWAEAVTAQNVMFFTYGETVGKEHFIYADDLTPEDRRDDQPFG